jgi:hypothetical protein
MRTALIAMLALFAAALAVVAWQHHRLGALGRDLAQAQTQVAIAGFEASAARADVRILTHYVDRTRVVRDTTHQLQREAPRYVTPATDRAYPLPVGFVRLHDAAAAGVLPGPAGAADAQAADVAASEAAVVIAGNYGTCHELREQLIALQAWAADRARLADASR